MLSTVYHACYFWCAWEIPSYQKVGNSEIQEDYMHLVECITLLKENFAGKSHSKYWFTILYFCFQAVFTFLICEEDLLFRHPFLLIGKIPILSYVEMQSACSEDKILEFCINRFRCMTSLWQHTTWRLGLRSIFELFKMLLKPFHIWTMLVPVVNRAMRSRIDLALHQNLMPLSPNGTLEKKG